ncbi:MAG TPA: hypothetical protein VM639_22900 [Dongiaceae bacterium]|nr:hypothetical protein [Dongiaceae bacterium]
MMNMLGYCMKNFGCAMTDAGAQPQSDFVSLIGQKDARPFCITVSINTTVLNQLNSQTLSPLSLTFPPEGGIAGVMLIGMFEIRMWWKLRPYANECGTVISRPVKKAILRERAWGADVLCH